MVSKSQIKLITGLNQKKYRDKAGLFVAEGPKIISELYDEGLNLHALFSSEENKIGATNYFEVTPAELKKISFLKTANTSVALFEIPKPKPIAQFGLVMALDAVRDPGNLGTIIRLCDWFGVEHLVCSHDTADCYNPKVVQATMGSLARVNIHYISLNEFLKNCNLPIYGGVMDGNNIHTEKISTHSILVMGNEANGISDEIMKLITHKITIPRFGKNQKTESLNVATATAILLNEFKRSIGK
ncbi:RNA methyltransferase [Aequorivita echinoideorum]|uniref:RNA methyltransferase n=1 Tax=Aequorivita echinoideorum TaxID=1549647 RepID=A0ABS5S249_9FLAO|nr:RNA methyltransferase [Aequorivita echinoideorum]MBT0607282.1 RNA methyltransferase [Aequorivita echinoideorum]